MTDTPESAKSAPPSQDHGHADSSSKPQSSSKRFVFSAWGDTVERELCAHSGALPPERTPIAGRTGVAVAKWVVVDRVERRELICNRLHDGECAWPWAVGEA